MMFPDCTLCNDTGLTPVDGGMVYPCSCLEKLPPVTFTDEDLDENDVPLSKSDRDFIEARIKYEEDKDE